ncbi:MAG: hypothetical protein IKG18_04850 [Atopobiaceae bacterium]|nr:hypothetical protein [Atopobiaceae bacterium]MBR3313451.1 hypothetical protein [Atopobiaceae bacterium]
MSKDSGYSSNLPTEEEIEEGRRSSLFVGLIIGGIVVAVGIVCYLLFGKYLTF